MTAQGLPRISVTGGGWRRLWVIPKKHDVILPFCSTSIYGGGGRLGWSEGVQEGLNQEIIHRKINKHKPIIDFSWVIELNRRKSMTYYDQMEGKARCFLRPWDNQILVIRHGWPLKLCFHDSSKLPSIFVPSAGKHTFNSHWALSSRACVQDVVVLELSRLMTLFSWVFW